VQFYALFMIIYLPTNETSRIKITAASVVAIMTDSKFFFI